MIDEKDIAEFKEEQTSVASSSVIIAGVLVTILLFVTESELGFRHLLKEPSWWHNLYYLAVIAIIISLSFTVLLYKIFRPKKILVKIIVNATYSIIALGFTFLIFATSVIVSDLHSRANGETVKFKTNPDAEKYIGFMYPIVKQYFPQENFKITKY